MSADNASTAIARARPTGLLGIPGIGINTRAAQRLILAHLDNLAQGSLEIVLPDGTARLLGRSAQQPATARMVVHNPKFFTRTVQGGPLAFAECYLDGLWDTPDLAALLQLLHRNEAALRTGAIGSRAVTLLNRLYHARRHNSRRGSRRNIAYHYDLGNDFYREWLDPGMSYSSALYRDGDLPLEAAQEEKYRHIARLAELEAGDRVLEIGCGWGGFMELAHRRHQAHVSGVTLSREQLAWTNQRMQAIGSTSRAALTDYRDTHGQYDAVVSIEMLEAVGQAHWPRYFETLYQRLKPGAAAVIQVITIAPERFRRYERGTDFIQRYVFPGGMLPTNDRVIDAATDAGLLFDHQTMFGADYARTLAEWRQRFSTAWPRIQGGHFDETFRRLWDYYLCYCEAGFRHGSIDVGIFRFRRPR